MSSFKRLRSVHDGIEDDSPSPSPTPSPTLKAARTSATPPPGAGEPSTSSGHILCTLPPTCNPPNRPTHLAGTRDLEAHYAMYHAHVCEEKGLAHPRAPQSHQTECHDPLAAVRKERGEKIFACHLATCPRRFSTPKTRRLHLIEAHGYPKEYFFAVTNKGVGGLLKRWGEGASLLRRPWRPRENAHPDGDEDQDETEAEMEAEPTAVHEPEEDSDDDEQILFEKMPVDRPAAKPIISNGRTEAADKAPMKSNGKAKATQPGEDADALANAMGSLSLVPTSIQFGRGVQAKENEVHLWILSSMGSLAEVGDGTGVGAGRIWARVGLR
ncbi:hypothetical protein ONZ51_g7670 [Trametes cubensis]|uniref:C2H2-type domain-containing protein n=1 Tax=Trametes cubensis TaxID=1111947 RepID=A0AAD7X994_9APHY|nr:hypothetical protein ONZ51_g7670 [Trametes cubensis]